MREIRRMVDYSAYIESIKALNRKTVHDLEEEDRGLIGLEREAQTKIEECQQNIEDYQIRRQEIAVQKRAIQEAERLQLERLEQAQVEPSSLPPAVPDTSKESRSTRARVGPQRYLILAALRKKGMLSIYALSDATTLSVRRIKDQLRVDVAAYIVSQATNPADSNAAEFRLTNKGANLLARFEAYRVAKGEPLPTLADAA